MANSLHSHTYRRHAVLLRFAVLLVAGLTVTSGTAVAQQAKAPAAAAWFGVGIGENNAGANAKAIGGRPGVVAQIFFDSPAELAGLRIGDQMVSIDGVPVSDAKSISAIVSGKPVGSKVAVVILRAGERREVTAVLSVRPTAPKVGEARDYAARAERHIKAGRLDAARLDADRAVEASGRNVGMLVRRATLLEVAGQRTAAILDYRRVLVADPGQTGVRDALVRLGVDPTPAARPLRLAPTVGGCAAETAALQAAAKPIQLSVAAPAHLRSGQTVTIRWNAPAGLSVPAFAAFSFNGPTRIVLPPLPESGAPTEGQPATLGIFRNPDRVSKDEDLGNTVSLAGVLALPESARGPLGMTFGAGRTRILVPLHQPLSQLQGSLDVRILAAGRLAVESVVVAITHCGERAFQAVTSRLEQVAPGQHEIVVQDPYDSETPKRILLSNSGRYRVNIFDGRFRVFETATGAKLVDRAGHDPNFSPTERFVTADVGDADGIQFEVVDLASREVVARPEGPFVGWTVADAFMLDGGRSWGRLSVMPTLLTRTGDLSGQSLRIPHAGHCHACSSWSDSPFMLDIDNSFVAMLGSQSHGDQLFELASGKQVCCGLSADGQMLRAIFAGARPPVGTGKSADTHPAPSLIGQTFSHVVETHYEIVPVGFARGWRARDPIQFSHIYDPLARTGEQQYADQDWYKAALPLRAARLARRSLDPASAVRLASATPGGATRGDWRNATQRRTVRGDGAPTSTAASLLVQIEQFSSVPGEAGSGLRASPPLDAEEIPFTNSHGDGMWATGVTEAQRKKKAAEIKAQTAKLTQRLLAEVPAFGARVDNAIKLMDSYPITGEWEQAKINLARVLRSGARWSVKGKPLWFLQLHENVANFSGGAEGALLLLRGDGRDDTVVNMSETLKTFWSNDYGRVLARLFLDRYLVLATVTSRNLAVVDLDTNAVVTIVENATQADLLDDVALTRDGRHLVQLNRDGQFFVYATASGSPVVAGRSVDDEIILYTPQGHYWSTYEGAHFVQLRFPGLPGVHAVKQFASLLDRPDVIKSRIAGSGAAVPELSLLPPPVVEASLQQDGPGTDAQAGHRLRVTATATSAIGLVRLAAYQDGQLIDEKVVTGPTHSDEWLVKPGAHARWLTIMATDSKGFVSMPRTIPLAAGASPANRLHAVLVGVDSYTDPRLPKLTYAVSDANRLSGLLRQAPGTAYYAARSVPDPLVDDRATAGEILAALRQVVGQAKLEDTILFSFAGHGLPGAGK